MSMTKKRVLIIAEAGVNHNGDFNLAKKLIDAASSAGADYIKFQSFSADKLVTINAEKACYQKVTTGGDESQYQMLKRLELSEDFHIKLIEYCNKKNIGFLSTAFDVENANMLYKLGQRIFKIPSGEITNSPYLRHIGGFKVPVILSTGMSNLGEIEFAISALQSGGVARSEIIILHCTSEYPAPLDEVNLLAMKAIGRAFGLNFGYSDHTLGIEVSTAAVALGASVIEKHITVDKSLPGPDHRASLEPDELKKLVRAVRNVEIALGDGVKRLTKSEILNQPLGRKSIVAIANIKAGEIFSDSNIGVKRPGIGMSPIYWEQLIGKKSSKDYGLDEMILFSEL